MKGHSSQKAYSWWWDSHISPKNTKWLAENLEEMDRLFKEMLRLIEEEGDSFAKRAEMYYQRRPELITHVEDFYRMYRALAERYNNVTGELCSSISDKSHSGDSNSARSSPIHSPESTPEEKPLKHKPSHRAAGFDVFLGSSGISDVSRKGSDMSSLSSDSESESESSKEEDGQCEQEGLNHHKHNGIIEDGPIQLSVEELENELSRTLERLRASELEIVRLNQELESKSREFEFENLKIGKELALANGMIHASEEEITRLRKELEEAQAINHDRDGELAVLRDKIHALGSQNQQLYGEIEDLKTANLTRDSIIEALKSEVKTTYEKYLQGKQHLEKLNTCIQSLSCRKSFLEDAISQHGSKIIELQASLSSLTESFAEVESQLKLEIVALESQLDMSKGEVEELNKDMDRLKLEKDKIANNRDELNAIVQSQNAQVSSMEGEIHRLQMEHGRVVGESQEVKGMVRELEKEVEMQKVVIWQGAESKREAIRQLCSSLDYYRAGYVELRRVLLTNDRPRTLLSSLIPCGGK